MSPELIRLLVNGAGLDFITSSRLLSLNKHRPVTSLTPPAVEESGAAGVEVRSGISEIDNIVEC